MGDPRTAADTRDPRTAADTRDPRRPGPPAADTDTDDVVDEDEAIKENMAKVKAAKDAAKADRKAAREAAKADRKAAREAAKNERKEKRKSKKKKKKLVAFMQRGDATRDTRGGRDSRGDDTRDTRGD